MIKRVAFLVLLVLALSCSAEVIIVDDDSPADFNNIQAAIDDANDGDTIIVQPGLYDEDINFLGKNITLTSTNPADHNVIAATSIGSDDGNEAIVTFRGTEDANCTLTGFNINGFIKGRDVHSNPHTHATISHCVLQGNYGGPAIRECDGTISTCLIADNINQGKIVTVVYAAISYCHGLIKNCTIANNYCSSVIKVGWEGGQTTIENCIIYGNYWDSQIFVPPGATVNIRYSNIQGGLDGVWLDGTLNWGPGNIDKDPCFFYSGYWDFNEPKTFFKGDYHLQSDSPCIDAGDPNYIAEPNETDLDGNPRIFNGITDMGAFEFQPLTPVELLLELSDYISGLSIHRGFSNSLLVKLNTAIQKIEDDNENNNDAAFNSLEAFINAVQAQSGKKISQADADALIASVQEILELLSYE
ncbi:MAG: choice-of-anchor Q domain-containing protein [Planctomycetota bacterium]|jgi:hypothetical protein